MQKPRINRYLTTFFVLMPILAIAGTIFTILVNGLYWQTAVLAVVYAILTGIGITAGYHRLFAHKAYKAAWPIRLILAFLGTAAVQGSILEWCSDHRNHHRYTDKEGDPYSVTKGFWYAHIGWIFVLDQSKRKLDNVKDLMDDPILRFQHKYFVPLVIFSTAIVPVSLSLLWGDPLGGLFIAGALRLTFNHHATFFINSLCHYWGKRTYERGTARDNWIISLVTYGEGFHNFHHKFAIDYRNGIRWFHFDPSKWLVYGLSKVGLTSHLKRIPKDVILQQRLDMQEQTLRASSNYCDTKFEKWLQPVREQIGNLQDQIKQLKVDYQRLKAEKMPLVDEYKQKISEYRAQIKLAKRARRQAIKAWFVLVNAMQHNQLPTSA